jgi:HD superfamily phosphohydrolase
MSKYKDPIYDENDISEIIDIIKDNMSVFRRLQNISQLSFINYLTENKTSRLEHMIGTYIIASKVCEHIRRINPSESEDHLYHLRIAAFLHDIGHPPFSHEWPLKKHHEDWSIICLNSLNLDPKISKNLLSKFIHPSKDDYILFPIVSLLSSPSKSGFDCDRADYFQRDRKGGIMDKIPELPINNIIDSIYYEKRKYKIPMEMETKIHEYRDRCFKEVYNNKIYDKFNNELSRGLRKMSINIEYSLREFLNWDDKRIFHLFKEFPHVFPLLSTLEFITNSNESIDSLFEYITNISYTQSM